ncbi:MAG TPA: nuclear transport factor 2 family protein [Candidatus Saccharimonadales bacterium]|nr:nuclear transport factor 2 family protein [Candidatus Saccharimonadales bacterium]
MMIEQNLSDKEQIKDVVTSVAQLQDLKQWERLESYFVKKPYVDNKSISGEMPAVISKKRLIDGWRKEIGSYFYATRHFIKRFAVRMVSSRRAKVTTNVEHVHYVADRGDRYVWTVRGSIDYILVKTSTGSWKISQMIFRMTDQAVRPLGAAA